MNMHATIQPGTSALARKAMLATVNIQQWSGRKLDRKATDETIRNNGARADAGRFNKALVSRDALAKITAIANLARKEHYARTLPWLDAGPRILSAAGYLEFGKVMRELRGKFDAAAAEFIDGYDDFREDARARLGGMFEPSDYPDASAIARRFAFDLTILPMPDAADFRVEVSDAEAELIRADIQSRTDTAIRDAMGDVFSRVCDTVRHMAEKLAETRSTGKGDPAAAIFRDSLVDNVRELVALLPSLNVTGDAMLSALADRMKAELCAHDASALREDAALRQQTAEAAASILSTVSDYLA